MTTKTELIYLISRKSYVINQEIQTIIYEYFKKSIESFVKQYINQIRDEVKKIIFIQGNNSSLHKIPKILLNNLIKKGLEKNIVNQTESINEEFIFTQNNNSNIHKLFKFSFDNLIIIILNICIFNQKLNKLYSINRKKQKVECVLLS